MPRLLVQADDNGLSRGVALGIAESIRYGVVRNTGLFTNMPASAYALDLLGGLPDDGADLAIGIDFNFVTGRPLSDPRDVPGLVDADGAFVTSAARLGSGTVTGSSGFVTVFADDPYSSDELLLEATAQLEEFVRLVGRAPDYAHFHSLTTPHVEQVVTDLALEHGITISTHVMAAPDSELLMPTWYRRPFPLADQAGADPESDVIDMLRAVAGDGVHVLICHPGYVDADVLDLSSFSLVRARDLAMTCSSRVRDALDELQVELVTYPDVVAPPAPNDPETENA
jgi:predicted glycoside hydrolase/deacetylase ChbG (UPF0249 family)